MENGLTTGDLALMDNGFGGNSFLWIFALLILAGGGFSGFGGNNSALNQEILYNQQFQGLNQAINKVGDGLASLGYSQLQQMDGNTASINGNITSEGRALQSQLANCCCENQRNTDALRYDISQMIAQTNATTTAQTQKILDAMAQNKIESLQAQVTELKTQNMFCGVPRINPYGYGVYAYNNGCNCGNI